MRKGIRFLLVAVTISKKKWNRLRTHTSHYALTQQVFFGNRDHIQLEKYFIKQIRANYVVSKFD